VKVIIKRRLILSKIANHNQHGTKSIDLALLFVLWAHPPHAKEGCPLPAAMHDGGDLPFNLKKRPRETL